MGVFFALPFKIGRLARFTIVREGNMATDAFIEGLKRKDKVAWRHLYDVLIPQVARFVLGFVCDETVVQDLVHSVLEKLLKNECALIRKFDGGEGELRSYLKRAAKNSYVSRIRHARIANEVDYNDYATPDNHAEAERRRREDALAAYVLERLDEILREFSEAERLAFRLRFQQGHSALAAGELAGVKSVHYKINEMLHRVRVFVAHHLEADLSPNLSCVLADL